MMVFGTILTEDERRHSDKEFFTAVSRNNFESYPGQAYRQPEAISLAF
jgi:hypothetical protein